MGYEHTASPLAARLALPDRPAALLDLHRHRLLPGPARGVYAALAFPVVSRVFYGVFVWARRALSSHERWFPVRAVILSRLHSPHCRGLLQGEPWAVGPSACLSRISR